MRLNRPAYLFSVLVLTLGVVIGAGIVAKAQTDDDVRGAGITFPVAELGNCGSKEKCKAYCEEPGNMEACIAFAEKHSLMSKEEASRAKQFSGKLRTAGGPGGCRSPKECETFCGDLNNIETCVAFAEEHGGGEEVTRGKKMVAYLKSGGQLPGSCTSKESCEAYCHDVTHAEECLAFAEKTGMGPDDGHSRPEDIEKIKKFGALAKSGETPGGCTSKEGCEAYCREESHQKECVAFGKKMGFIDEKREEFFKQNRGKGPGGCTSHGSCEAFCNDPANRETCFNFAKDNGLMRTEDVERAKEGMVRMRAGLEQAPPEVAECLKTAIGPNIIEDIQSGKLVPGPEIGERVRGCFERSGERRPPQDIFRNAPPETGKCASEKLGADAIARIRSGEEEFTPEAADAFRVCFQQQQFEQRSGEESQSGRPEGKAGDFGGWFITRFGIKKRNVWQGQRLL